MKNFFKWLKNTTKVKRWIFLMILGAFLVCFGFSKIFVSNELGLKELAEIILSFVIGFVFFVVGIVFIQKRNLELLIEGNKSGLTKFDKNNMENNIKGPNIVVIGGGNGLNNVLKGLKKYTNNITAIVSVSDYGKKQIASRKELKIKPSEDIKNSIIALANDTTKMEKIMNFKFDGKFKEISFSELYLSAMEHICGDFAKCVEQSNNILCMTGKVLPVTLDEMKICAELQDGTIVDEKDKIAETVFEKVTKINRVYLNPSNCKVAPGVLNAIKEADAIVIGPGSLYTNVIPSLLVKNVAKTIRESKGLKIYVSNIMTEPGQTDDYDVADHINAIIEHSGNGIIDFCIADNGEIIPEYLRKYNLNGSDTVEMNAGKVRNTGVYLLKASLATTQETYIRHDSDEIAKQIIELICSDLKFKDKHNDEQYIMLNSKLKNANKKKKTKKQKQVKVISKKENKRAKKLSKFSNKYKDRIQSIKESDETRKENLKIQKKAEALLKKEKK